VGKGREYLAALLIVDVALMKRAAKKRNCLPKKCVSEAPHTSFCNRPYPPLPGA
jgi:hypothetical protein